ncbi:superoxide dismutase [Streptomyces globisporus]|uniref:Superoxide dismutase n=3 Tax=Streptomyces griseus group TaxID=629295 RepID=A0ABM9GUY5_STRGL|nr:MULTISPECIES: superoxide dismutase [Streptomyces]RDL02918.1 Fe-Mn family superoxide dismutase [Streptomyces sp. HB202]WSU83495.1 superoxide dismutase [Streptomyces globisporus]GGW12915.1 superoxide dismutase [Fe-Zn] 1 [Streptomyces globisporus]CAH9414601.1 Superoxide dismutase [Fe-Zn] (EC [Streptomyces globisporus]
MATYTLPELPYDYAALEPVINPQIIELHHDKHHAAYVKGANDTLEQLEEARDKEAWGAINGLQKNLAFHLSGHILHSIYWHNMTGEGGGEPHAADGVGDLADAITESFGSYAGFKSQLTKAAATTQGSGWGVLAYEPVSGKLIVEQVYDHQGNVGQGSVPILVFDAWEHAFYLQYKNQKVDFIEAMWQVVNWQDVAKRYAAAKERVNVLLLAP